MPLTTLARASLGSQATELLRDEICRGRLAPGARIVELSTAAELGVSRTPLREALGQLAREGLVVSSTHQGYRVAPLSEEEVRDLYPILGALEALCLRSVPDFEAEHIERLRALNARIASASGRPAELIRLDASWHEGLLERAGNGRALEMAASLRRRVERYEYAYMKDLDLARRSPREHEAILEALDRDDVQAAAEGIEAQWVESVEAIALWIGGQSPAPEA
jgi:DNA-binding GntR family transcriptional regulator